MDPSSQKRGWGDLPKEDLSRHRGRSEAIQKKPKSSRLYTDRDDDQWGFSCMPERVNRRGNIIAVEKRNGHITFNF